MGRAGLEPAISNLAYLCVYLNFWDSIVSDSSHSVNYYFHYLPVMTDKKPSIVHCYLNYLSVGSSIRGLILRVCTSFSRAALTQTLLLHLVCGHHVNFFYHRSLLAARRTYYKFIRQTVLFRSLVTFVNVSKNMATSFKRFWRFVSDLLGDRWDSNP